MHKTKLFPGTDARNWVVRCECGWAYSSTNLECIAHTRMHQAEDNEYRWHDQRRRLQPDFRWGKVA